MRVLLAIPLLAIAAACVPPGQDVPFDVVLDTTISLDIVEPEESVSRDETEWCEFWARAHSADVPPPECDTGVADFESETIISIAMGSRPSGCFDISVEEIVTGSIYGSLTVTVAEQVPGAGCFCTASITSPTESVVVAGPVGEIDFVYRTTTLRCE